MCPKYRHQWLSYSSSQEELEGCSKGFDQAVDEVVHLCTGLPLYTLFLDECLGLRKDPDSWQKSLAHFKDRWGKWVFFLIISKWTPALISSALLLGTTMQEAFSWSPGWFRAADQLQRLHLRLCLRHWKRAPREPAGVLVWNVTSRLVQDICRLSSCVSGDQ